ncbi:MAG: hypothetical protein ACOC2W_02080 [bacterium]
MISVGSEKDKEWAMNSEFCVECDNERELNRYGVCEECWENSESSDYEDWEVDEDIS